jgi:ABC-type transporter Mla subunit MlaD
MEGFIQLSAVAALVTGIGVVILVILSLKSGKILNHLTQSFETVEKNIPERHLLENIGTASGELSSSLDAHKKVVVELPQLVSRNLSKEVQTGIDPVKVELSSLSENTKETMSRITGSLEESHKQFIGALLTLNAEGRLTEWVNAFREVVEPLQSSASSLKQHYDTAERLLKTTEDLVVQWTGQRQVVENAFKNFSEAVQRWTVEETTRFSDVEHRIMNRLEEVANTNALVSQSLSELQTAQTNMTGSQRELSDTVKQMVLKMREIMEVVQRSQEQHVQLNRGQAEMQNQVKTLLSEMENRTKALDNRINKILSEFESVHRTFAESVQNAIKDMNHTTKDFNKEHTKAIESLRKKHEQLVESQGHFVEKQELFFNQLNTFLDRVPTKKHQVVLTVCFSIQLVLSILIVVALLVK